MHSLSSTAVANSSGVSKTMVLAYMAFFVVERVRKVVLHRHI
jgi:hypothetical protein